VSGRRKFNNAEINLKKGATTVDLVLDMSKRIFLNQKVGGLVKIFTTQKELHGLN
jgi:hypothetical protein